MKILKSGLGIWQILNSNIITDIIAKSGFDLIIFDLEHGLHSPQTINDCVIQQRQTLFSQSLGFLALLMNILFN